MLLKMFIDPKFKGVLGERQEDLEDFKVLLDRRVQQLKKKATKNGVGEESNHLSLACELIQACLQHQPEDRWVGGWVGVRLPISNETSLLGLFILLINKVCA